jgi:ABC-type transporter MlaC component
LLFFLCDEIFSKSLPILVTVEPISSAILKIELADTRKAEDWKKHWKCLEENGYYAIYLVSDEGVGICTAHKEALADIIRQPDTYHAIAHQLGHWVEFLENAAYKAIKEEYDRYDKIDSAKTDNVMDKRIDQHEKAQKITNEKIEMYDSYHFLYSCLIDELKIFDNNGNLRDRKKAEANINAGLDLLETLGDAKLTKVVDKIRRTMPELLNYFDIAKSIVDELMTLSIDQEALRALCLAWQYRKRVIKAKKANPRQYCSMMEQFYLELAADYLQESYDLVKVQVDMKLDQIVQSSSLVECINSIIRPYLNNSKNQIVQETLNLIMFYHNHRRYTDGKRKEKTPIEILTGKKQEKDWIELILDIVEKKNPSFFACSR